MPPRKTIVEKVKSTTKTIEAFAGSIVQVTNFSDGTFGFYRDTDKDGWADSKGNGRYMMGLSRIFAEHSIEPQSVKIDYLIQK